MRGPTEQLERFGANVVGVVRGRRERTAQTMRANGARQPARAFTLLEMLVVVAIIGIITSLALGAMYAATERARRTRTETLVRKLHIELMRRWESYETRRLPIVMTGNNVDAFAAERLIALRELMRMELPDRYGDFWFTPTRITTPTPLNNAYRRRIIESIRASNPSVDVTVDAELANDMLERLGARNQSAEMLYLILSTPMDGDDFAGQISEKYVGDTDEDGMLEFLDAWGNPIEWIRWPAGFLNADALGNPSPPWGYVTDLHTASWLPGADGNPGTDDDNIFDPDPFDVRGNEQFFAVPSTTLLPEYTSEHTSQPGGIVPPDRLLWGYRLVPLIVSAGPDGEYGLAFGRTVDPGDVPTIIEQYSKPYYFWEENGNYIRRGTPRPYDYGTQE